MPTKRNIPIVFTTHALQRMRERNFSTTDVQLIADYGDQEILPSGNIRYSLSGEIPDELRNNQLYYFNRNRKIILTGDCILKTVISNDEIACDYETYTKYVELS
jgi:hypothetical protein